MLDFWILKTHARSKYVFRCTTYYRGIPTLISHHLSLGWYLEYNMISLWESVQIYQVTRTGIKDKSSSFFALYVDSSTVCGFFLSWRGALPQYHDHSIWDCTNSTWCTPFSTPQLRVYLNHLNSIPKLIIFKQRVLSNMLPPLTEKAPFFICLLAECLGHVEILGWLIYIFI